jgi:hypothetical protein
MADDDSNGDAPRIAYFTLFHAIPPLVVALVGAALGGFIGYMLDVGFCLHFLAIFASGYFSVLILTVVFHRLTPKPRVPFWRVLIFVKEGYGCFATIGCIIIAWVLVRSSLEKVKQELNERESTPVSAPKTPVTN